MPRPVSFLLCIVCNPIRLSSSLQYRTFFHCFKSSHSDERMLLIREESFFFILLLPRVFVFHSPDEGLLIFLSTDILPIGVLCDMPLLLHSSLSAIDVLLCSY